MRPQTLRKGRTPLELGAPVETISIDLTERCTLRCAYCFADRGLNTSTCKAESGHDLDLETGKAIIDWFLRDEVSGPPNEKRKLKIDWWGGEPLIKFDLIKDLVTYGDARAREAGKSIVHGGTTNVTLLTKDKLDWLLPRDIHFLLSVDGIGIRNDLRPFPGGVSSWPVIFENLDAIVKAYNYYTLPAPGIRMTSSPGNIKGMFEDIRAFYSMGFHSIFFSENYDDEWTEQDYADYEDELKKIIDWRLSLIANREPFLQSKFLDDMTKYILRGGFKGIKTLSNPTGRACGAGKSFMGVSVEGALYICHRANKHNTLDVAWDAKENCIGSIYEDITNAALLNELENLKIPYILGDQSPLPQCKDCMVDTLCLGGCYAVKLDVTGDLTGQGFDRICRIKKIFYRAAMYGIVHSLENMTFREYSYAVGVPEVRFIADDNRDMPNCACNMGVYTSTAETIDGAIRRGQLTGDQETTDAVGMLLLIRNLIDDEVIRVAGRPSIAGCVCNAGTYNRDKIVQNTGIEDGQYSALLDIFFQYWRDRFHE